ncbi:TetR/AcrR family transcriptional regulator [Ferribacterium limneticum]|uniref:TetR/AcrR family transcriptional regulator n=1 Tax=Ferribacterium limneticum TaxID=76259 RepID=UPI001CF87D23|nr:TetR/AcrR family transcriptional regulator [Ferribacterium limneticum]UCV23629.1 TetR/AcrR family transcriptional regulator [Ferribacterium limneticum]
MTNPIFKSIAKKKTREGILELSVPLFARYGYDGVSMRDVATVVGLTPAALYHHFPDKEHLYLDAVVHEFQEKGAALKAILVDKGPAWTRLSNFVAGFARLMVADKDFLRLMQWVLLDSDEGRQHILAEHIFKDLFVAIHDLAEELDPGRDAHLLAISIVGLVIVPFQTGTTRKFMPGYRPQQDNPEVLAEHICDLLRLRLGASG